jgi:hypothetical protein
MMKETITMMRAVSGPSWAEADKRSACQMLSGNAIFCVFDYSFRRENAPAPPPLDGRLHSRRKTVAEDRLRKHVAM